MFCSIYDTIIRFDNFNELILGNSSSCERTTHNLIIHFHFNNNQLKEKLPLFFN